MFSLQTHTQALVALQELELEILRRNGFLFFCFGCEGSGFRICLGIWVQAGLLGGNGPIGRFLGDLHIYICCMYIHVYPKIWTPNIPEGEFFLKPESTIYPQLSFHLPCFASAAKAEKGAGSTHVSRG